VYCLVLLQVYRKSQAAVQACPVAQAAANLAVKAFKRIKSRLALPNAREDM
jgi:hypothetical protein